MKLSHLSRTVCLGTSLCLSHFAATEVVAQQSGCTSLLTIRGDVDYDRHIQPLFDRHCVSCHQPGGQDFERTGLDLRSGRSHQALVGEQSALAPTWTLVTPYQPDALFKSLLTYMVSCETPPVGRRMPPVGGLTTDERILLESWIYRGAAPGASGAARQQPIQAGHSGTWIDPSAPGQGFSFEVVPQRPMLFVAYWLTYQPLGGQPLPVTPIQTQRWMLATGNYADGDASVTMDVQLPHNGAFDFEFAPATPSIGNAVLTFHSCTEASLRYDLRFDGDDAQRVQRTIALRRLTPNTSCRGTGTAK